MPVRKVPLVKGSIYHIYSRSIADFRIFNSHADYTRIQGLIEYYSFKTTPCEFSIFKKLSDLKEAPQINSLEKIVDLISYCIMPTHIHLAIKETNDGGISEFLNRILKSYTRYFNIRHGRKGPLWEGRFNSVLVKTHEQLLHLTRYIHLNPVTAFIVNKPEEWEYSSYGEFTGILKDKAVCTISPYLETTEISSYKNFVNNQIDYQRSLGLLKKITIE